MDVSALAAALASGALVVLVVFDALIASDAVAVTADFGKPLNCLVFNFRSLLHFCRGLSLKKQDIMDKLRYIR